MEHLVHSFDGWTLLPHCCVLLRFCLSGSFCRGEVYKQLSRIFAIYVRILIRQFVGPCIYRRNTYVFSAHIRTLYVRIRTYTYVRIRTYMRTYSVRIRTYMRTYSSYIGVIRSQYVRIRTIYKAYTCIYLCVRIEFRVLV